MQFIKGVCLFGLSFGIVFCAACFASAQELPAEDVFGKAKETAQNIASIAFAKTEAFRATSAAYLTAKLVEAEAARAAKEKAKPKDGADLDKLLVEEPKSLTEQVKDSSGIFEGIKMQAYKTGVFVLENVYVFYGLLALVVLWLVRKIIRRYRGY